MAKRLIYLDDAIEALAKAMPPLTTPDGCGEFDHDIQIADEAFVDCMQIINELPYAQPERKTGKWISNSPVTMKCDQCGYVIKDWKWNELNFCANCGADMRGDPG